MTGKQFYDWQTVADRERRASKRQIDLADIARLLESHPELRARVSAEILARIEQ